MEDNYVSFLKEQAGHKKKVIREDNKKEILQLFDKNPNPEDSKIHALATKLNVNPHELEDEIYEILTTMLKKVGKHRDTPVDKFDPEQIEKGKKIEREHTDDPNLTVEIAKDHLAEIPDYYTRLEKMEKEAKEYWKGKEK